MVHWALVDLLPLPRWCSLLRVHLGLALARTWPYHTGLRYAFALAFGSCVAGGCVGLCGRTCSRVLRGQAPLLPGVAVVVLTLYSLVASSSASRSAARMLRLFGAFAASGIDSVDFVQYFVAMLSWRVAVQFCGVGHYRRSASSSVRWPLLRY